MKKKSNLEQTTKATASNKRKAANAICPPKAKKKRETLPHGDESRQTGKSNVDDDAINISDDSAVEEDAEDELSTLLILNRLLIDLHEPEKMSKQWTSPVYAFFEPIPAIEIVDGRRCHVFKCCARGCKYTARRYLDKGDKSSTGNLIRHVKACWREDAWNAASACRNADDARKSVTLPLARNGTITGVFERKGKGNLTYSHVQHTREETK
jgi:hypothetical protein